MPGDEEQRWPALQSSTNPYGPWGFEPWCLAPIVGTDPDQNRSDDWLKEMVFQAENKNKVRPLYKSRSWWIYFLSQRYN